MYCQLGWKHPAMETQHLVKMPVPCAGCIGRVPDVALALIWLGWIIEDPTLHDEGLHQIGCCALE
jgi:hypothetical protein